MRLLIHVEGQTEETFVNVVLAPHLLARGYVNVSARLLGNARLRRNRGGIRSWPTAKSEIVRHLRSDPTCVVTTMVDFYGLPSDGLGAWPGRSNTAHLSSNDRALSVEQALRQDIAADMGPSFDLNRFIPFVLMYEFEGLLFSDPAAFVRAIGKPSLFAALESVRLNFPTPEQINDSPLTAPSKRLTALMSDYEKPIFGVVGALEIGLQKMRDECPHFAAWLTTLELVTQGTLIS